MRESWQEPRHDVATAETRQERQVVSLREAQAVVCPASKPLCRQVARHKARWVFEGGWGGDRREGGW
jgi:hypothetical protein